jgi:hypothetical protein
VFKSVHFYTSPFLLALFSLISAVGCPLAYAQNQTPPAKNAVAGTRLTLGPVRVRGYGKVSGSFHGLNSDTSQLVMKAESVAEAQRLHAQFLSDVLLLPGVSTERLHIGAQQIEAHEAQGQGIVVAVREGTCVCVFTAPDPERLAIQLRAAQLAPEAVTNAEVTKPVRLDRGDKIGYRFGTPASPTPENPDVWVRTTVSHNGLYDVWALWNRSAHKTHNGTVNFPAGHRPPFVIDARDARYSELATAKLEHIALKPRETRVFFTPRRQLARAPLEWFQRQRRLYSLSP